MYKYLILFLVHTIFTYSLNCFNKIWQCAFIFVLLALLTNFISFAYNAKKAAQTVFLSTLLSLILSLNKTYFIQGEPIDGLFFASYLSILISCTSSAFLFSFLSKNKGFSISSSSFLAIVFAAFLDGFVMMGFFIHLYSMTRVSDIFVREVGFKSLYAGMVYGALSATLKALALLKKAKGEDLIHTMNDKFPSFPEFSLAVGTVQSKEEKI